MTHVPATVTFPQQHLRLEQIQSSLEARQPAVDSVLNFIEEQTTKDVLQALLTQKLITEENILRQKAILFTAQRQRKPNPKLIAVFCLYLIGSSRQEIAKVLHCTEALVRLRINEIYQIFDLEATSFSGTIERRRQLYELAIKYGMLT